MIYSIFIFIHFPIYFIHSVNVLKINSRSRFDSIRFVSLFCLWFCFFFCSYIAKWILNRFFYKLQWLGAGGGECISLRASQQWLNMGKATFFFSSSMGFELVCLNRCFSLSSFAVCKSRMFKRTQTSSLLVFLSFSFFFFRCFFLSFFLNVEHLIPCPTVYWCKLPVTGYRHFASSQMCAQILLVRSKSQKSFFFIVCRMVLYETFRGKFNRAFYIHFLFSTTTSCFLCHRFFSYIISYILFTQQTHTHAHTHTHSLIIWLISWKKKNGVSSNRRQRRACSMKVK